MENRTKSEWTLGLIDHRTSPLLPEFLENFYCLSVELFSEYGLKTTHLLTDGKGYTSKWIKHGGVATHRLVDSGFEGRSTLGLCHVSPPATVPSAQRVAETFISYSHARAELALTISFNCLIVEFQGSAFENILRQFIEMNDWDFGWSLVDNQTQAASHISCINNGKWTTEEQIVQNRWFASTAAEQIIKPRDVYPVNVFHANHLELMVGGKTLGEFIREVPGTRVEVIAGHTVWTMPPEMVDGLREELGAAGILIARG